MANQSSAPETSDSEQERIHSIDSIAGRQDRIESKLDQLLGIGNRNRGGVDGGDETSPSGRPGSVEEQVRAELQRAESERRQAESAEAEKSEFQQMKDQMAKLTEVKPAQPQPRRQRMMWGKHG